MYFHCAGVVSEEQLDVIAVDKTTITLDDGEIERKFERKSGKCLNDNNFLGAKRTVDKF